MAVTNLLIDIGSKLLVGFIFAIINTLIIREIVVWILKLEDKTMATALHVSLWISIFTLILSFIPMKTLVSIVAVVLTSILFMILVNKYYKTSWKKSLLMWLVWFIVYIKLGIIIALISVLF